MASVALRTGSCLRVGLRLALALPLLSGCTRNVFNETIYLPFGADVGVSGQPRPPVGSPPDSGFGNVVPDSGVVARADTGPAGSVAIGGRLLDESEQPIAMATVRLSEFGTAPFEATTDANGAFRFMVPAARPDPMGVTPAHWLYASGFDPRYLGIQIPVVFQDADELGLELHPFSMDSFFGFFSFVDGLQHDPSTGQVRVLIFGASGGEKLTTDATLGMPLMATGNTPSREFDPTDTVSTPPPTRVQPGFILLNVQPGLINVTVTAADGQPPCTNPSPVVPIFADVLVMMQVFCGQG